MAKHTLHVATFSEYEVDVPEKCPFCAADLTEPGALVEWNWTDTGLSAHVTAEGVEIEGERAGDGDGFFAETLVCDACQVQIAPERAEDHKCEGPPPYDAATATGMYDRDEG